MKKYTLMHKNFPVADLELDEASGAISTVGIVYEKERVPVGIPVKNCYYHPISVESLGGKDVRFQPAVWGLRMH